MPKLVTYFLPALIFVSVVFGCPLMPAGVSVSAHADASIEAFTQFTAAVKIEARHAGVRDDYLNLLDSLTPLPRVKELVRRQPEYIRPIWQYLELMISDRRLMRGREMLNRYQDFLANLADLYGVPPEVLIAIWGIETNFGSNRGKFPVLQALATLGYEGRRAAFGRQQLIAALKILEAGDIVPEDLLGSWAGAMGHTQFIPTTYLDYAIDATGDGKRDIWNSPEDALGSAAHYLKVSGWVPGLTWGQAVRLPADFDYRETGLKNKKPLDYWRGWGVRDNNGRALPTSLGKSAILTPAGHRGPAFIVTQNFFVILRYNTAPAYALAIGHLSDMLANKVPTKLTWPHEDRPLHPPETLEMQKLLLKGGYKIGRVDGIAGSLTRKAIRAFQADYNLIADGYATPRLLDAIRATFNAPS